MAEEMKKPDEVVAAVKEAETVEVKQPEEKKETVQEPVKRKPGRKPKAQKEAEAAAASAEESVIVEKKPARGRKAGVKKEATEKKEAVKKADGRKTAAAKKAAEKKAPAEKKPAARKAAQEASKQTLTVQFSGKSYSTEDLVKIAKDVWVYDLGGKEKDFKSVDLYVKPEENSAYYVINGEVTGSFSI